MTDLKVFEKSRKLLIQVMGQEKYDEFIENGKIEICHGNTIYELDHDAKIINKTKNQSYCIQTICSNNLPIHDLIAIKYSYLKHNIDEIERVANKTNLINQNEQEYRTTREYGTTPFLPENYDGYIERMESLGYRRSRFGVSRFAGTNDIEF